MKQLFIGLLLIVCCNAAMAQYIPPPENTPVKTTAKKKVKPVVTNLPGYIIIFRGGQLGTALSNYNVFIDGTKICKLSNGKFLKYQVQAGKHAIEIKKAGMNLSKSDAFTNIVTKPGRISYLSCNIKTNLLREKLEILEVMESSGKKSVDDLKEDNCQ